jgi:hypothetical protein
METTTVRLSSETSGADVAGRGPGPATVAAARSALATEILRKHQEANQWKLALAGEWMLNQAFLIGKQHVVYDRAVQMVREVKGSGNLPRIVENRIAPLTMSMVQLMDSSNPQMELVPSRSQEIEDAQAAEVSAALLGYVYKVTAWPTLTSEMNWWRAVNGTSVIRFWMDPTAGDKQVLPLGDSTVEVQEGEIRGEVYSPWDVSFFPCNAPTPRHLTGIMFTTYMPVEDARAKWPEMAAEIVAGDDADAYEFYKRRVDLMNSPQAARWGSTANGMVRVYEYIETPSAARPKGRKVVVAGRVVVEDGDNIFADMFESEAPNYLKLGCVVFRFIPVPGRIHGRGVPEDARPLQVELNETKTDMARHRKANMRARIFIPDQSAVNKLTNETGQVTYYRPVHGAPAITVVPPVPIANSTFAMLQMTERGLMEVSNRPEVARGFNDRNVRSAEHMGMLMDSANQPFGVVAKDTEEGYAACVRLMMGLAGRYYSNLKLLRIVGAHKGFAVDVIRGANLYTDVSVVRGSGMPRNKALWNQMLAQMLPLVSASQDEAAQRAVRNIIEQLDLGGDQVEKPDQADKDAQDTELRMLSAGQMVPVKPWDNHIVHREQIAVWLKKHPQLSPFALRAILAHDQAHGLALIQMMTPPPAAMLGRPYTSSDRTTGDRLGEAAKRDNAARMQQQKQQQAEARAQQAKKGDE